MAGLRGEVRVVDLDPTRGHEQAKTRPCIVVSDARFNRSASGLVVVVPLTTVSRGIPWHVRVVPEGDAQYLRHTGHGEQGSLRHGSFFR